MCRLFNNLGFKNKYVIFDLLPFSLLQKYYLESMGYNVLTLDTFYNEQSGILCISDLDDLKNILKTTSPQNRNLFIGTWSISETPLNLRSNIFQLLENFNFFLLAFQDKFREVNNIEYFENIKNKYPNIRWDSWKIDHIPGNNYLIGNGIKTERSRNEIQ